MWYFSWVLGVGLAVTFGILNGMWHEFHSVDGDVANYGAVSRPDVKV